MRVIALLTILAASPSFASHGEGGASAGSGDRQASQRTLEESRTLAQERAAQFLKGKGASMGLSEKQFQEMWEAAEGLPPGEQKAFYDDYIHMSDMYREAREAREAGRPVKAGKFIARAKEIGKHLESYGPAGREFAEIQLTAFAGGSHRNERPPPGIDEIARTARDLYRDSDGVQTQAGHILRGSGDSEGAAQAYRRAAQLNPKNAEAWKGLAQTQVDFGDYEGAVESGMRALALKPGDPVATSIVKNYRGRAAASDANLAGGAAQGSGGSSAAQFRPFSDPVEVKQTAAARPTLSPEQALSRRLSDEADRYLGMRDAKMAAASARKAVDAAPDNKRAWFALYRALLVQRDLQGALKAAEQAAKVFPDDPVMNAMKVNALNLVGRYEDALASAEWGLAKNPSSPELLLGKGFALSGLGRYDEARAAFREAGKDPRYDDFARKAMGVADDELVAFFTGTMLGPDPNAKTAAAPAAPKKFRWGTVLVGISAGLLLALLGIAGTSGGRSWTDAFKRLGSASPAVSALEAPPPVDGLAASGIRIDRKIGAGGMGLVYEGTDTALDRKVAVKRMREEIRSDVRERERFIREAKTVAGLRHPHIVEIYSIVEDGSDVYLVFEYVTGKTVHDLTYEQGALPWNYALAVTRAVASALDYAHKRGVIHRDLKPANIMVEEDGMVKVMDFGVARQAQESLSRMMTNTVVGTPPYMAPEQEQGIVRKESDVYALAVCLYEMVVGRLPFAGVGAGMLMAKLNKTYVPPSKSIEGLPAGFDDVIAAAFEPDPDKRLSSGRELVAALERLPVA